MSEALKPCPFCGHTDADLHYEIDSWERVYFSAYCTSCGASGPEKSESEEAISAWNRRAPKLREAK